MVRILTLLFSLFLCLDTHAQAEVSGEVTDSTTGEPLPAVTVTLMRHGGPIAFTHTDGQGRYSLTTDRLHPSDSVQATSLGYARRRAVIPASHHANLRLQAAPFALKEVQVRGNRTLGRADTTVYDLTRFATERDNTLKDVLRKLPGVDIADNGEVSVNGRPVSRFTVEGLDMTGGRYGQLEENIKAKDVKKAEVIEHDQPIKALQNKVMTDNVAMNIVMKDSVRDKLMPTLRPYLLVGDAVGGRLGQPVADRPSAPHAPREQRVQPPAV